jgi:hypothetical protein
MLQHDFKDQQLTPEPPKAPPPPIVETQREQPGSLSGAGKRSQPIPPGFPSSKSMLVGLLCVVLILSAFLVYTSWKPATTTQPASSSASEVSSTPGGTTATPPPTATTPLRSPNPYAASGSLALSDPLADNTGGYGWMEETATAAGDGCRFREGAYHVSQVTPHALTWCVARATDFSDFAYEIQMRIIQGGTGGMILRGDAAKGSWYFFTINQQGQYWLVRYDGFRTTNQVLLRGTASAWKNGTGQENLLAFVAQGADLSFYANGQKMFGISDATYSHGQIGVIASDAPAEVVYSNAKVWTW